MKQPIRTDPVEIFTVQQPAGARGAGFLARTRNGELRSASTSCHEAAAWNLALRWFWGGNTKAFAGTEERSATAVDKVAGRPGVFVAQLVAPGKGAVC